MSPGSTAAACPRAGTYLVDVWCLGVKNCNGPKTMDRRKLPGFVSFFFSSFSRPPVPAPLELAQQTVFGAVGYARGMGLEPHPDFAKCAGHLGKWNGSCDITFGRDGMPMYIQGPHDDMFAVMVTLRKTVGDGNFHYLCQDRLTPPSARLRSLGPGPAEPAPRGLAQVLALAHASC